MKKLIKRKAINQRKTIKIENTLKKKIKKKIKNIKQQLIKEIKV